MDSCCIALINAPGHHELWDQDWENAWKFPHGVKEVQRALQLCDYEGCGKLTTAYKLPRGTTFADAIKEFLKPSIDPKSQEIEEHVRSRGRTAKQRGLNEHDSKAYVTGCLRTRERRSDWDKTCVNGDTLPQGIHYPLITMGKMATIRGEAGKFNKNMKNT